MKTLRLVASCYALLVLVATASAVRAQDADPEWPRTFDQDGLRFTLYQPQLEKWDGVRILAHSAVSVETPPSGSPTFGVVWTVARTEVDKEERIVTLTSFKFARASFPSAADKTDEWLASLRKHVPDSVRILDLDRLEASLALVNAGEKATRAPLKNDPPRFFFSTRPSILVLVDGKPILRRLGAGTGLDRVVNTRALLLQDEKSGQYYLRVCDRWLTSATLDGVWRIARDAPDGADSVERAAVAAREVDLHEEDPDVVGSITRGDAPLVFTSTEPAELIETAGEPDFEPIEGTRLRWIQNTDAAVFQTIDSNTYYVLASGRWFRAASREGPWTFVPGTQLPADFAKIPESHPASEVLASVPGTPQAREAAIENGIPETATVNRDAKLTVTYDGEPALERIPGTTLGYFMNTPTPVIQAGDRDYACDDGVWFTSDGPTGPWVVADAIPAEIYTIPPSCPLFYVTFVRIYEATPDTVYVGYTPGYFGTCVTDDGSVVWGTGFWQRPWVGERWIGRPWTYGFGVGTRWSPAGGWGFGIAFGASAPPRPWWGPYAKPLPAFAPVLGEETPYHVNLNNANVYSRWLGGVVRAQAPARRAAAASATRLPNNVYSSPEGEVYRQTEAGWERRQQGSWSRETASAVQALTQQLEAEHRAREQGSLRTETLRQYAVPARPNAPHQAAPGLRGGTVRIQRGR
jgi:hypothetical protein